MANRKISELTALAAPAAGDFFHVVDISEGLNANKNKKITYTELLKSIPDGSAAAPSLSFDTAATTGLYRSAANELSIATNGAQAIKVEANNKTTIYGDLVVTGTQTTVSSTTITVADKNLELATGNSADTGADGGGLTIKGATDKTWNWVDSTDAWTANQDIDVVSGKVYRIGGVSALSSTTLGSAVVNSSLTSVGTLGALTVTNAVTAGSLDISGDADIDGTMEADAYTVNGTALNEYIADTVGAMVSSNTETNITVTYEDSDNTLDFVIGTLNQNTTGTAGGLSGTPNITVGDVVAASLDISGNADIDGTLETDALTIDGTALNEYIADTVGAMVGSNTETGITVTYEDSDNTLDFVIGTLNQDTTGNAATATALETARTINGVSFDGTGNITVTAAAGTLTGTELKSTVVTSSLTSVGTLGALTVTNAVTAGSLDISGDADIDGTMEADAYTVNGTALNEYIADTVGAMVSSNTETNITVTYEDSDNTLDFVIGTLNQDTTGNAATATALETARTIGGVSFDGTGNINLPGVNASGNQNTSGTAAGLSGTPAITVAAVTAASLDISGDADIDGTLEADAYTVNGTALNEYIADTVGAMVSSNTETNITVTYEDSDNTLDFVIATLNQDTTGNAATATALETARTIGGTSFDGTANITPANATNAVNVTGTIASAVTGTTQSASDNSTKIATTAYVETAVASLIDSAPGALNTLNELAAAIGDDANFSTTITNSLATKVPLSTIDTKGDIYVGTANDTVTKLAAGSNGQVLKANSSESTGLEWATISTTDTTYSQSFVDSSNDIILRLSAGGSGSGNDDVKFVAGSNITLTHTDADNITIAASGGEITVQDEGSSLSTAATTLNFVGAGVTASGTGATKTLTISGGTANHKILTLRNAANNGSATLTDTDFTLVQSGTTTAQAIVSAQQLLVSVNGVIQQPNAGTSTSGLDGFVVDTGTTGSIKFCAAPGSGAEIFIVQLGDTVDVGTPSNDTVNLAQLAHATQGDILYYGGSGVPARLTAGTSGYYLKTQGSGANPVWAAVPAGVGGATGVDFNDNVKSRWGTGNDLEIFHNASDSIINDAGTGSVKLQTGGATKVEVTSTGATITGVATVSNGIVETAKTIGTNHTITTNYNAMSVGPVSVSATLTIPSGSVWTIV